MTPTKGAAQKSGEKKKAARPPAKYHLFTEGNKGVLTPVGEAEGKTVAQAVDAFLASSNGGNDAVREQVKQGKATLVVVPDRNFSRVKAETETVTKSKITVS